MLDLYQWNAVNVLFRKSRRNIKTVSRVFSKDLPMMSSQDLLVLMHATANLVGDILSSLLEWLFLGQWLFQLHLFILLLLLFLMGHPVLGKLVLFLMEKLVLLLLWLLVHLWLKTV